MTVPQAFALALQHHQAGRLADAEALYRQILSAQPNHADSWHLLGVIAHAAGKRDLAVEWIRRAISLDPDNATAYYNLGNALKEQGRMDEAIAAFEQALARQPASAEAHNNLGNSLHELGRFDEAVHHCRRAIALKPDFVQAHYNLGNALKDRGDFSEAIAAYRRSIALDSAFASGHNNLGIALAQQKQHDEAIAAFREAIRLDPAAHKAHNNLGLALVQLRRIDEAIASYRSALALTPDYFDAHVNLGLACREKGQYDNAVAHFQRALELDPNSTEASNNLGSVLKDQGLVVEAIAAHRRSLQSDPDNARVHSNIILAMYLDHAQNSRTIAEEQQRWNARFGRPAERLPPPSDRDRNPERRLRIGYVSPDFRDHVVGRNLVPLFREHDSEQFEILCYSEAQRSDNLTTLFRQRASQWRNTADLSDQALAEAIRRDRVDILVDLSQHTADNRLAAFAYHPAPIQVSFAGYPAATGLETIRYRLSDPWLESKIEDRSSEFGWQKRPDLPSPNSHLPSPISHLRPAEQVRFLDSFWCYDPCGVQIDVSELPATKNGFVTFGCLNSFCKINEPQLKLWAKVLGVIPDSRLLVLSTEGSHRLRMLDILQREGVPSHRVDFATPRPRRPYLELYHRLDLTLDTFPYNGHTTSLDSLWMGVPVVSLAGELSVSRGGLSVLSNLGLPELTTHSGDDFVQVATGLARDLPRLGYLRSTLRRRLEKSVLMDGPRFARQIEAAYRTMWRQWCAGATPE
ncbi:MAG TPA: tetratricopeptide repeat protein [Chthoniobacter sp.]|jgi:predicted O-linked N-acetylglucosamine transferase (SPINDLY family)